ncbi:MAG: tRNA (adenosine(37)-N6)-threonylcarbamoyltransferase complex dimerization subunit type 1 TsaB [Nitrospirae bacterium]|nr:tRNA (adenosine(37)-N6)-threonylcarbamoyltransferase complex dimerization subunit type 1 TsaB [Nitrospirota bacterium]
MRILSIDTSSEIGGVALIDTDTGLLGELIISTQRKKKTFSERLMPSIDFLLSSTGCHISDVEAFAVTVGPGSFTGLRVGLSTVKGLAFATGKPVLTIPTLQALAYNFRLSAYPVCAILDARKDEVYGAVFQWQDNRPSTLVKAGVYGINELLNNITSEKIVFTGEAIPIYQDVICKHFKNNAILAQVDAMYVSPVTVGLLGLDKLKEGDVCRIEDLAPLYFKKSQAEERYGLDYPPDDNR